MKVFRDNFWERVAPAFPEGRDPYNSLDEVKRRDAALVEAMETAWRACVNAPSTDPFFLYPSQGFIDHWHEYLATPDRGHEFFPYD